MLFVASSFSNSHVLWLVKKERDKVFEYVICGISCFASHVLWLFKKGGTRYLVYPI